MLLGAIALMVLMLFEQPLRDLYASMDETVEDATGRGRGGGNGSENSSCA